VQATHHSGKRALSGQARHLDPERVTEADHHGHMPGRDYVMHTRRHTLVTMPRVAADERLKHRARKAHKLFGFAAHLLRLRGPHQETSRSLCPRAASHPRPPCAGTWPASWPA
jgi:hypothetical protein